MFRLNTDKESLESRLAKARAKVAELDKDKYSLQLQLKEKASEVKN